MAQRSGATALVPRSVRAAVAAARQNGTVKLSEFELAVAEEFGAFGRVLRRDTVIVALGNRTPDEALAAGVPTREVWFALCAAQDVPPQRWHGAGRPKPTRG